MEKISQDKTSVDTLYDILELNVGAATNMTMKVVACGLNLVLWGILSLDSQGREKNRFSYPPGNLLNKSLLYSCHFPLPITLDSSMIG